MPFTRTGHGGGGRVHARVNPVVFAVKVEMVDAFAAAIRSEAAKGLLPPV